ncbi:hypothetical protein BsWGS_04186 [Bradybaena similaris]
MTAKTCLILLVLCAMISAELLGHYHLNPKLVFCQAGNNWYGHGEQFNYNGRPCTCRFGRRYCGWPRQERPKEHYYDCVVGNVRYSHGIFLNGTSCSCLNGNIVCQQTIPEPSLREHYYDCVVGNMRYAHGMSVNGPTCSCFNGYIVCREATLPEPSLKAYTFPCYVGETKYGYGSVFYRSGRLCTCKMGQIYCSVALVMDNFRCDYRAFMKDLIPFVNLVSQRYKRGAPHALQYVKLIPILMGTNDPDLVAGRIDQVVEKLRSLHSVIFHVFKYLQLYVRDEFKEWVQGQMNHLSLRLGLSAMGLTVTIKRHDTPKCIVVRSSTGGTNAGVIKTVTTNEDWNKLKQLLYEIQAKASQMRE